MKALVCKTYGPPEALVVEEQPSPRAGAGQVVISVRAAGVNFPDTLIIAGKYQFKPEPPFSPGGEMAGVIKEVGEGVTGVAVGDRVIAVMPWGGFAEEVLAGAAQLMPIPDGVDFATAASFVTTYGTSYYALAERAAMKPGETLLVLGAAGGVGLAAVELGKVMGARVIAAASSAAKLEVCKQHGADMLIDYSREDLKDRVKALTGGAGVDVVYDPVGGAYTEAALRATAWNGRLLVVGFAAGDIPKLPANLTLLKGCSIVGVFWGSFLAREPARMQALFADLAGWLRAGKVKPHIGARFPLARGGEALRELMERRAVGKLVLEM